MMLETFRNAGATVFTASWPNWTKHLPFPKSKNDLLRAQLEEGNAITKQLAKEFGAVFLDVWDAPVDDDPTYWSTDQIHPNARGYLAFACLGIRAVEDKTGYTLGEPNEPGVTFLQG